MIYRADTITQPGERWAHVLGGWPQGWRRTALRRRGFSRICVRSRGKHREGV